MISRGKNESSSSRLSIFARPSAAHEARVLTIRARYGVKEDLINLAARIPGVGRVRARLLVNAGYANPADIASAEIGVLVLQTGISLKTMDEIHAQYKTIIGNEINNSVCISPEWIKNGKIRIIIAVS